MQLVVTVHAKKDAFIELAPQILAASMVTAREHESFGAAVDVMEAERPKATVITANLATSTLIRDHVAFQGRPVDTLV
jgi:hypothetical protein